MEAAGAQPPHVPMQPLGLRLVRAWVVLAAERGAEGVRAAEFAAKSALGSLDPHDLVANAYEAFQREIHSFALHATRDAEVAADITQDAYLKLFREAAGGRAPENTRAWLYRVASNLIINRARHLLVVDRLRQAWGGSEDYAESPEQQALHAERSGRLRAELARLPREARVGLLLAASGFSGREVADAIGRSELATRSLMCRARLQLRERLAADES